MGITPMEQGQVVISKEEYDKLKAARRKLQAMYAAGVDNWGGMEMVYEILDEELE